MLHVHDWAQIKKLLDYWDLKVMEKEMATHSSILAWRIPWTEEPGGLYIVHGVTKNRNTIKTNVEEMVNPYKFFFLIFKKFY